MFNFFTKLVFLLKRPKIIVVAGDYKNVACGAIFGVLNKNFKVEKISRISVKDIWQNEILIFSMQDKNTGIFDFFVKKSKMPVLVVTAFGEIPNDKIFFAGDIKRIKSIIEIAKNLPKHGRLIFCSDDEAVREIQDYTDCDCLSFGFGQKADFCASDVKMNGGTNFKINYKGNIVPVWIERGGKENIYDSLSAVCCGIVFDMNLVEISEKLKK